MTTAQVNDPLTAVGFDKLKVALEIAFEHGGFEAVVSVCKDMTAGVAGSEKTSGSYAATEWRELDFLEAKFPGSTRGTSKYYKAAGIKVY